MAGYSGTPLLRKLGIEDGHRVALLRAPDGFTATLGVLPPRTEVVTSRRGTRPFDVVVYFVRRHAELVRDFGPIQARLDPAGGFWVAWPKRAAKVPTDITEDRVREIALAAGLVDNKVCAIDEVWSALRCVVRKRDRPAKRPRAGASGPAPADLEAALARSKRARETYAALPPSHRRRWHEYIDEAKRPETRARRIAKAIAELRSSDR